MAEAHSIPPFPADIDRNYFATWLSGFADGEASFTIRQDYLKKSRCTSSAATFEITLRLDDYDILQLVQSFFGCGTLRIYLKPHQKIKLPGANPQATFKVHRVADLADRVVGHFDTFPLLAKKKKDYAIWREAVLLAKTAKRKRQMRPGGQGTLPRWTSEEIARFGALCNLLREQRKYAEPPTVKLS